MRNSTGRRRAGLLFAALLVAGACGDMAGPSVHERQILFVSPVFRADSFAYSNTDILFASLDGEPSINLTRDPAPDARPQWSPDGMRIAFVRVDSLYVMEGDGTGTSALTGDLALDDAPAWSPTGHDIAVARQGDIWIVDANGAGLRNASNSPGSDDQPAWSPDGSLIAFGCEVDGWHRNLCVVQANGTGLVTRTTDTTYLPAPAWSPDGREIAYVCRTESVWGICLIDPEGTDRVELTTADDEYFTPVWSPDGTRIAYASGGNISVVGRDDGAHYTLTNDLDFSASDPQWSPDGQLLAYSAGGWGVVQIYVQSPEDSIGTTRQLVTPIQGWSPRWRPRSPQ
jgi:TolB protein